MLGRKRPSARIVRSDLLRQRDPRRLQRRCGLRKIIRHWPHRGIGRDDLAKVMRCRPSHQIIGAADWAKPIRIALCCMVHRICREICHHGGYGQRAAHGGFGQGCSRHRCDCLKQPCHLWAQAPQAGLGCPLMAPQKGLSLWD